MRYLTAVEAAKIIGVSDRTIRDWIKDGKLTAHHATATHLAIPENEVERIARERKQYQTEILDSADIAERLASLETAYQEVLSHLAEMEIKLAEMSKKPSVVETPD